MTRRAAFLLTGLFWLIVIFGAQSAHSREITFAWDAGAGWPAGTTVELCSNGVCATGITATQHTLNVPVVDGDLIDAKVRAVSGGNTSAWVIAQWRIPGNQVPVSAVLRFDTPPPTGPPMTIAYVNGNASNSAGYTPTIAAAALNVTTGNAIFVAVSAYGGTAEVATGVTDTAGNTYTRAGADEGGDASHHASIWYALNITGNASNVVTAAFVGAAGYRCIAVTQFSGIATSGAYDQSSTLNLSSSGTTHTSSNTGTTTQADEVVIASYIAWDSAQTLTGSAPTVLGPDSGGNNAMAYKIVSSTGAQSTTLTSSGSNTRYAIQARTFKAATGGGGFKAAWAGRSTQVLGSVM